MSVVYKITKHTKFNGTLDNEIQYKVSKIREQIKKSNYVA
jgi:hypothetical protein